MSSQIYYQLGSATGEMSDVGIAGTLDHKLTTKCVIIEVSDSEAYTCSVTVDYDTLLRVITLVGEDLQRRIDKNQSAGVPRE